MGLNLDLSCAVDVCDTPTAQAGTVCDRCAEISFNHGPTDPHGFRLCDGCGVAGNLAGVVGGEGSADWLCPACFGFDGVVA